MNCTKSENLEFRKMCQTFSGNIIIPGMVVGRSIINDAINIKLIKVSPAWPRCPPGSWGLTSRGSRSSRPRRTCRRSSAARGRSYCRQSGSWVSSSSCSLVVGWGGWSEYFYNGEGQLTSPVHPALTVLTVPQETVHQMEEILIFLLQLNILLRQTSSFTALTQHQEDGADE